MFEVVQVAVTIDSREAAVELSRTVVAARVAACAQVGGPITSTYWWQGAIESAEEWVVVCKTTADVYPRLEALVRELHPYENPEVLATPVIAGNPAYLAWVHDETHPGAAA